MLPTRDANAATHDAIELDDMDDFEHLLNITTPQHTALRLVYPPYEGWNNLPKLSQHQLRIIPRLRKRMHSHPKQHGLKPLSGTEESHIR